VQRCTLFAAVNAKWTTGNQKLLVMEPQWIKSTERAKRLLIPAVYSLREIRVDDELQIVVTEVGQVKQTVTVQNKTIEEITLFIHLFSMESSPNSYVSKLCLCLPMQLVLSRAHRYPFLSHSLADYERNLPVLNVQVKPHLCTPRWRSGSEGLTALILDLGTRWKWVVSITPRSLYV